MTVTIKVNYPEWMDEVSVEEFNNVLKSARRKAIDSFVKEFDKAEAHWKERKKAVLEGQFDIYDYA